MSLSPSWLCKEILEFVLFHFQSTLKSLTLACNKDFFSHGSEVCQLVNRVESHHCQLVQTNNPWVFLAVKQELCIFVCKSQHFSWSGFVRLCGACFLFFIAVFHSLGLESNLCDACL